MRLFLQSFIVRTTSSSHNVQITKQTRHFVTSEENSQKFRIFWGKSWKKNDFGATKCEHFRKSPMKYAFWVSCLDSLVFLWCRRAFRGSGKSVYFARFHRRSKCLFCMAGAALCDILTCCRRVAIFLRGFHKMIDDLHLSWQGQHF